MSGLPNAIERQNLLQLFSSPEVENWRLGVELAEQWPAFLNDAHVLQIFRERFNWEMDRAAAKMLILLRDRIPEMGKWLYALELTQMITGELDVDEQLGWEDLQDIFWEYKMQRGQFFHPPVMAAEAVRELSLDFETSDWQWGKGQYVDGLPESLLEFSSLRELHLYGFPLRKLSDNLLRLSFLETLTLDHVSVEDDAGSLEVVRQLEAAKVKVIWLRKS